MILVSNGVSLGIYNEISKDGTIELDIASSNKSPNKITLDLQALKLLSSHINDMIVKYESKNVSGSAS